jgi:pimeloyl-ACP methyl ester carboxylesterase
MTPLSWEHWVTRYEERGMTVLTPGYPGIKPGVAGVEALREDPSVLNDLGVREVLDHLGSIIQDLGTKPIIMGHSFGGAFAQLLVGAGLGSAGVSIDGAGMKGVNALPFSEIRSTLPILSNPLNVHRSVALTAKEFHYAFTNTLDEDDAQAVYQRYAVATPGRIVFQGALGAVTHNAATTFDFSDDKRASLLFISGGSDHILPPVIQRENYDKCAKHSTAISSYTVFEGRDHFTCGEPGWETVADFALDWALNPKAGVLSTSSPR